MPLWMAPNFSITVFSWYMSFLVFWILDTKILIDIVAWFQNNSTSKRHDFHSRQRIRHQNGTIFYPQQKTTKASSAVFLYVIECLPIYTDSHPPAKGRQTPMRLWAFRLMQLWQIPIHNENKSVQNNSRARQHVRRGNDSRRGTDGKPLPRTALPDARWYRSTSAENQQR